MFLDLVEDGVVVAPVVDAARTLDVTPADVGLHSVETERADQGQLIADADQCVGDEVRVGGVAGDGADALGVEREFEGGLDEGGRLEGGFLIGKRDGAEIVEPFDANARRGGGVELEDGAADAQVDASDTPLAGFRQTGRGVTRP